MVRSGFAELPGSRVPAVSSDLGVFMRKLPLVLLVALAGTASGQPGADAPYPPPPPDPQPYPQPPPQQPPPPQPYAQPVPYQPGGYMPVQLSRDDAELLQRGEITEGAHFGGAAASIFLGFGLGQAIQGRYGDTGWIFTVGEAASFVALMIGVTQMVEDCFDTIDDNCNESRGEGLFIGGLVGFFAFRIWEVVDAFGGPSKHNRKVRELRMRLGMPVPMYTKRVMPYVNRTRDSGATAGLVFRF